MVASILVLTASLSAQTPIAAKLVIPETTLLPGVPFEAWIELENRSGATLAVGLYTSLQATTAEGPIEFQPDAPDLLIINSQTQKAVPYLELASGARETITLPIASLLSGAGVFTDARITGSGRYGVALRLDAWPLLRNGPPPDHFAGPVVTNEVMIDRITPTGTDAEAWAYLQTVAEDAHVRWSPALWSANFALLNAIVTRYPDSNYVPYALLAGSFGNVNEKYLELTLGAIRRFSRSPVIDQLRWTAAGVAEQLVHPEIVDAQRNILRQSKRPTTRDLVYGPKDPDRRPPDPR
ncbi:MAG TPA: hypothetical protein VHW00_01510 [Thermoanaerobaculia bacterium]|nr:hypothetical protein [Thermoanaerobaculia bacterium]